MNREIKFRAWFDKNSKEHNYILKESKMEYDVEIDSKGRFLDIEGDWDIQDRFTIPIMQFTGLKDKDGVEIYEGDICYGYCGGTLHVYFGTITWGKDRWSIKNFKSIPKTYSDLNFPPYECSYGLILRQLKVIGNIYENPEFLESEKKNEY